MQTKWQRFHIKKNWKTLPRNAFVDEDYPLEIQQRRHMLWAILKIIVKTDEYKGKAKLKCDKLILDGIEYGVEDLNNLPDVMSTLSSLQKSNDNMIVIFRPQNMLSSIWKQSWSRMSNCRENTNKW